MNSWLKRTLVLALSFTMCIAGIPTQALSEEVARIQEVVDAQEVASPAIMVRTQTQNDSDPQADATGWLTYELGSSLAKEAPESTDDQPGAPITSLEVKFANDLTGLEYRLLDDNGTWSEEWSRDGERALTSTAAHGVQARLVADAATQYDLWYRSQTATGTWLGWTHAGAESGSARTPIVAMQFMLTAQGEQPSEEPFEPFEKAVSDTEAEQSETAVPQDEEQISTQGQQEAEPAASTPTGDSEDGSNSTQSKTQAEGVTSTKEQQELDERAKAEAEAKAKAKAKEEEVVRAEKKAAAEQAQKAEESAKKDKDAKTVSSQSTSADNTTDKSTGLEAMAGTPIVEYKTHVQSIGWQGWQQNGGMAGTSGQSKRLEAIQIRLKNADGHIQYRTHAQTYGWLDNKQDGAVSGTTGESKRLEAVEISLTGNIAKTHDVWYRAHVQRIGWQGWVCNGAMAGTSGRSLRVEALEILLVRKGDAIPVNTNAGSEYHSTPQSSTPAVYYQTHAQTYGWQDEVKDGAMAGTSGQSKRLEALRVMVRGVSGGVTYRTHVQRMGWQGWRSNGEVAGTSGQSLRLEAIEIKLTGDAANRYDIWYRCHVQRIGWMGWAKNGARAGSEGCSFRMEAMQIKLVPKGSSAPSNADAATSAAYTKLPSITYNANLANGGWKGNVSNGATAGQTGVSARIRQIRANLSAGIGGGIRYDVRTGAKSWQGWRSNNAVAGTSGSNISAIKFELTGNASNTFDVWYRAHIAHVGWLDWTKNGGVAGGDSSYYALEAFEVQIRTKSADAPGAVGNSYVVSDQLNGVDISGWDDGINIANTPGDFFIIKATEGVSSAGASATRYNPQYKSWANQVLSSNRLLGFYHYANGGNAITEADTFYEAIKDYKGRAIACLDWEGQGNPLFDSGMDVAWCKKFLDRLKSRFGGTPFLYTSKSFCNSYNWSSVASSYPLWGAEYPDYEDVNGYQLNPWQSSSSWGAWGRYPTIFQYTGTGVLGKSLTGVEYFDFDLFYGNRAQWNSYLA